MEYFLCIGSTKYTRTSPSTRKTSLFSSIVVSFFYIRIFTKKQAFDFLKRNSYRKVCLKSLCDAKLITPLLIFYFLVKIWTENSISLPIHSGITYFWIWLFGAAKYQGLDKAEARSTDGQPLSEKPPLIRCEETYSARQ